jgi:hypothetical protein
MRRLIIPTLLFLSFVSCETDQLKIEVQSNIEPKTEVLKSPADFFFKR